MAAQQFALKPLRDAPKGQAPLVRRARRYLEGTHASVGGLVDSFNVVHEKKVTSRSDPRGRLAGDEVDLLRAALVFTSSGLDATCQTLVGQCLPVLVDRPGSTAATKFDLYLEEQARGPSIEFVAALKDPDPRAEFVRLYVAARTKASYQGTGDLKKRVRDLIGVPKAKLSDVRVDQLKGFFTARNDIVHDLDYVSPQSQSSRRHTRSPGDVVKECDLVLALLADLIEETATILKSK